MCVRRENGWEEERRDAIGYRGERQGEGKDRGECCERCLNPA